MRMARAGLGISVRELSEAAKVAESTILRYETEKGGMQTGTLARVQSVLEAGGIEFLGSDGVRLRAKQ
jgi:transcriptional regulator with XRE-family HTH domain